MPIVVDESGAICRLGCDTLSQTDCKQCNATLRLISLIRLPLLLVVDESGAAKGFWVPGSRQRTTGEF